MLTAQSAVIVTLTADLVKARVEIDRLTHESAMQAAQITIDTARINRLLGNQPVPPRRMWESL